MNTASLELPSSAISLMGDYRFENVYLHTTEAQRSEIVALWRTEGVVQDPEERERRSHETVLLIRNSAGELAGVSTVGFCRVEDGRTFYAYRMFLRPRDRASYLMVAVILATREFLRHFRHPELQPAGMLHVNENPKLMRPGVRKLFARHGYEYWGKTDDGLDVWAVEFAETNHAGPTAPDR